MKVAHIYGSIDRMHGATKWLLSFSEEINRADTESKIFCINFSIKKPFWFNSQIYSLGKDLSKSNRISRMVKSYLYVFILPLKIDKDTDVIVLHSEISLFAAPLIRLRFKCIKIIYYCYQPPREAYDLWPKIKKEFNPITRSLLELLLPIYRFCDKLLVRLCDHFLVWGIEYKNYFESIYGTKKNISLIPAGVDFEYIKNHNHVISFKLLQKFEDFDYLFLTNASLISKKNLDVFIKTIKQVNENGFSVGGIILGEGPIKNELIAICKNYGIESSIIFTGFVNQITLPSYYFISDIIFYLELNGAWSLSIIEAGAAKKPVIVAPGGSMETLVKHEESGIILNGVDEIDLIASVAIDLIQNKEKRDSYGEKLYKKTSKYSLQNSVKEFNLLIDTLLE